MISRYNIYSTHSVFVHIVLFIVVQTIEVKTRAMYREVKIWVQPIHRYLNLLAVMAALQLSLPHSWNSKRFRLQLGKSIGPLRLPPSCALSKQGQRFFTSLATSATGDPLVTDRLIRKFIASSSKSVALNALSHLLTPNSSHPHLSSLAFPVS